VQYVRQMCGFKNHVFLPQIPHHRSRHQVNVDTAKQQPQSTHSNRPAGPLRDRLSLGICAARQAICDEANYA